MQFERGEDLREKIDNVFMMFYFNLLSGDYSYEYCESEIEKHVELEEYEIAEGIKKAINFKKYGNSEI